MKTVAVIAARMGSIRFPGKVMQNLDGVPVLDWVVDAALAAVTVDEVWIATTTEPRDDIIPRRYRDVYRGSETDVLRRYAECAEKAEADIIVRLTGDCPFADPNVIDQVVTLRRETKANYAQNVSPATWPDGLDVEVFDRLSLELAHEQATRPSDRDCLTQYMERNRFMFSNASLICPIPQLHKERFVLDTKEDYEFCQEIAERLKHRPASYLEILKILDAEPRLRDINMMHGRNERFFASVAVEHA